MIVADLKEAMQQGSFPAALRKGFEWLVQMQGQDIPDGRVEIDDAGLFALVQSYNSKARGDVIRFEAHRKYIDIQYVVSGEEYEGWATLSKIDVTVAYIPEKDVLFGPVAADDITLVRLKAGQVAVFYPTDAHAPMLAIDEPSPIKKIVVKVPVEA